MLALSITILVVVSALNLLLSVYSLFNQNKGNVRILERERNVHNAQVSELLDRLAWKDDKPYGLPPRPPIVQEPEGETEVLEYQWREV